MIEAAEWKKSNVLIFKDQLLPFSETFILESTRLLKRFTPYFVGVRRVKGIALPPERVFILNGGGWKGFAEMLIFRATGRAATFCKNVQRVAQPSLIHAHFGPGGILAADLAGSLQVPLIVTFHGFDVTVRDELLRKRSMLGRRYVQQRKGLNKKAAHFIAVSEFIRQQALKKGIREDKIAVHYTGIDTDRFNLDRSRERDNTVLYVGRLVEKKGVQDAVEAMALVQEKRPEAKFVIVGDGPLRESLEAKAAAALKNYAFLGRKTPAEIVTLMQSSKVFLAPSIIAKDGDAEGLGMVFLEAQACGLPVVSTLSGGIPEAVSDGRTGYLAHEHDINGLAQAVSALLNDRNGSRGFSEAAREWVLKRFDLKKQTVKLESLYANVIERNESAATANLVALR